MERRIEILTELQEIAPFLGKAAKSGNPYRVPAGYFDDFADILMTRIRLEDAEFNDAGKEMEVISPLLAALPKKNPYEVPQGYFEEWKVKIPASETKLVAIPGLSTKTEFEAVQAKRNPLILRTVRYAAAACIVALLGITLFNISNRHNTDPIKNLTTISEQDIANYLDSNDFHLTDIISQNATETASLDFTDSEIHELLSSVSDAELEAYMPVLPIEKRNVN